MKGIHQSKTFIGAAIFFVMSIMLTSSFLTFLLLYVFYTLNIVPDLKHATMAMPFFALVVSVAIGFILSAIFSRTIFRPLQHLIKATRIVAKGDFTAKIDGSGTAGEVRELIESFNAMTKELSGIELFRNDFINTFSHEFKTPIVSIRGFAKQLKAPSATEEERNEYADIIISEAERLAKMSSNILLLSKLENQQIITDRVLYSLDEQLRSDILLLQKQWEEKNLVLSVDLENTEYCGNPELLSHVWRNLLENAVKFCPEHGNISVKCYRKEDMIHVIIENDCEALRQDTLNHIFDKFYQGDASHASEGNGLGLSLVKRIIQLCGGYITVVSDSKDGISFDIELPCTE
ncbi:MAG: HAMP domain-containing histidine kinase [Clostridiales bacterium]|jgi:integral membrane sensor signal transduction histidine kinase|nr:HAMP domain-containing histidine kinase [Clostridiales bacterium]